MYRVFRDSHNINCTIEKIYSNEYVPDYYEYLVKFDEGTSRLEQFLTAVDIYEATSINVNHFCIPEIARLETLYGKNSLEDLTDDVPVTTDVTTTETISTTVLTTAATKITTAASNTTLTTITAPAEEIKPVGDADGDNEVTVRDCSFIAVKLAKNDIESLPKTADYNKDGFVNVRDPAAIARDIAKVNFK